MNEQVKTESTLSGNRWILLAGFALVAIMLAVLNRPDRPVSHIAAASSLEPTFVVQIVRPRLGLPLGGLLPPQLFGQDAHLGFNSQSKGATVRVASFERLALSAEKWELSIVLDSEHRVTSGTEVVFDMVYEDQLRTVRCRPMESTTGTISVVKLSDDELSGTFDIELAVCEDALTGKSLGWPPRPLILHGSFDRLPMSVESTRD